MPIGRRPWTEELAIIDRTMKAISDVTDPENSLTLTSPTSVRSSPGNDCVSLSRRNLPPPQYLVTR